MDQFQDFDYDRVMMWLESQKVPNKKLWNDAIASLVDIVDSDGMDGESIAGLKNEDGFMNFLGDHIGNPLEGKIHIGEARKLWKKIAEKLIDVGIVNFSRLKLEGDNYRCDKSTKLILPNGLSSTTCLEMIESFFKDSTLDQSSIDIAVSKNPHDPIYFFVAKSDLDKPFYSVSKETKQNMLKLMETETRPIPAIFYVIKEAESTESEVKSDSPIEEAESDSPSEANKRFIEFTPEEVNLWLLSFEDSKPSWDATRKFIADFVLREKCDGKTIAGCKSAEGFVNLIENNVRSPRHGNFHKGEAKKLWKIIEGQFIDVTRVRFAFLGRNDENALSVNEEKEVELPKKINQMSCHEITDFACESFPGRGTLSIKVLKIRFQDIDESSISFVSTRSLAQDDFDKTLYEVWSDLKDHMLNLFHNSDEQPPTIYFQAE